MYLEKALSGVFSCGAAHLLRSQVAVIVYDVSNCEFDSLAATKIFCCTRKVGRHRGEEKFSATRKLFYSAEIFSARTKLFRKKFLFNKKIFSLKKIFCSLQNLILQSSENFFRKVF